VFYGLISTRVALKGLMCVKYRLDLSHFSVFYQESYVLLLIRILQFS